VDDWAGAFLRERMQAVLSALGDGPGTVLDAGMGGGRLVEELERRGWTAYGIDTSPKMVELAVKRLPLLAERLTEADLAALPFEDASFDAVAATGAVEYVGDLNLAVGELARVLRPAGKAAVSFPNYRSPYSCWRRYALYPAARLAKRALPLRRPAPLRPLHPITPGQFEAALEGAGLQVVARRPLKPRIRGNAGLAELIAPQLLFEAEK
jgi:SAM-dependent methyltransferase